MDCVSCNRDLDRRNRVAGISIMVMGDEYIYSYWYCPACQLYTVEAYHDRFLGDDEISFLPPLSKDEGDRAVALIRACPDPFDKNCDCDSHRALYYGRPGS